MYTETIGNTFCARAMGRSCHTGRGKGFRLIEAENEEQLMNLVGLWYPTENYKLVPYFYGSEFMPIVTKWSA